MRVIEYTSECHNNAKVKTESIPQNTKDSSLHNYTNKLH